MSRLYIKRNAADGWHEVVTDSKEDVRFTFTFDNLSNPTNYVSERSVSAKLPRCPENDIFFGHVCRLDSIAHGGNGYDPATKMQYIAMDSAGMIVSEGDAVINEVTREHYSLSLIGTQSAIFSRLLNAGYGSGSEDYWQMDDILARKGGVLDVKQIMASWRVDNPVFDIALLDDIDLIARYGLPAGMEREAFIASLIGFAPTLQGKYPNFENDKWLNLPYYNGEWSAKPSITPALSFYFDLNEVPTDRFSYKGTVYEQQISEYRSYYQQPYIYVSALWQMFRAEFEAITKGYRLELDDRWFTPSNDELNRLVYMLPQQKIEEKELSSVQLEDKTATNTLPAGYNVQPDSSVVVPDLSTFNVQLTMPSVHVEAGEKITFSFDLQGIMTISTGSRPTGLPADTKHMFNNTNPIHIRVKVNGIGSDNYKDYLLIMTTDKYNKDYFLDTSLWGNGLPAQAITSALCNAYGINYTNYTLIPFNTTKERELCNFSDNITVLAASSGAASLEVTATYVNTYSPYFLVNSNDTYWWYGNMTSQLSLILTNVKATRKQNCRSDRALTLKSLFGDIKPFTVLLQYSKAHHLLWEVDNGEKKVIVKRAKDAFADFMAEQPIDITNNTSTDVTITPVSWSSRSVLYNMGDMETDYTKDYEKRFGVPYGSKRLITVNALNEDEKSLFEKDNIIKASAVASLSIASLLRIISTGQSTPSESNPFIVNISDEESANVSGNFYYRHANRAAGDALTLGWRDYALVTDDSREEVLNDTYCWHGDADVNIYDWVSNIIPVFNTVSDSGLSVLFAPVREVYTLTPDVATSYLYERAWQGYTEEVYNIQNKTVETLVYLPRNVFDRVRRNPLVIIDHVLYIVTEIRSWSEHNTTVRCKMRQITNINNLTS